MEGGGVVEVEDGVMRVLLVDDSPVDRRVVELLLSNTFAGSFHVIAVDSAKKAMEFLGLKEGKEQAIDMVLTDYCMPEMTGYDLLKAIKALSPLKPIPVIVMSSENEPQRISRAAFALNASAARQEYCRQYMGLKPFKRIDLRVATTELRCLKAGAEDFIVKPLQSKDVQRLRNCSTAKPKDPQCKIGGKRKLSSDHVVVDGTSPSGRRAHFTGIAMVELSHYFPFLFKFILLVYAVLCLGELLHIWSNGCFLSLWCA